MNMYYLLQRYVSERSRIDYCINVSLMYHLCYRRTRVRGEPCLTRTVRVCLLEVSNHMKDIVVQLHAIFLWYIWAQIKLIQPCKSKGFDDYKVDANQEVWCSNFIRSNA